MDCTKHGKVTHAKRGKVIPNTQEYQILPTNGYHLDITLLEGDCLETLKST